MRVIHACNSIFTHSMYLVCDYLLIRGWNWNSAFTYVTTIYCMCYSCAIALWAFNYCSSVLPHLFPRRCCPPFIMIHSWTVRFCQHSSIHKCPPSLFTELISATIHSWNSALSAFSPAFCHQYLQQSFPTIHSCNRVLSSYSLLYESLSVIQSCNRI